MGRGAFPTDGARLTGSRSKVSGTAGFGADVFNSRLAELMPGLLAKARSLVGSTADAQDVVQQSLLIAFTRLDQLRDVGKFGSWLRAIVVSQAHRMLRSRGREVSFEALHRIEPLVSPFPDPLSEYERTRVTDAVQSALEKLPLHLRQVSDLYYRSGYTHAEIAEHLELRKGTVRKRLHTAQPLLAEDLAGVIGEATLRVGYLPISDHLLGMVAHRLARGRNSRVSMQRFLSWGVLAKALERGRIDAAFIMAPLAMHLFNTGTRLKYILDGHHDGSALAATSAKGKGKLVGVPGPYSTHRVLLKTLAREHPGLLDESSMADTNPSYAIRSLKRQVIDAFFCAEPWSTKCVREGQADVHVSSKDVMPGHPCCVVAVRESFSLEHPGLVAEYLGLLLEARDKLGADPDYCAQAQEMYTGIPRDLAGHILEKRVITFDDLQPDLGRMQDFMRLALAARVLAEECDLESFVCRDFL